MEQLFTSHKCFSYKKMAVVIKCKCFNCLWTQLLPEKRKQLIINGKGKNYISWVHININIHLCLFLTYYKPFISTAALLEDVNMHEFVDTWLLLPLIHTLSMFVFWIQHPVLLRHCENSNTSLQHALFDVTTSNLVNFIFNYLSLSLAFHRSSEPDAENAVNTLFEELAYRQNDGKRVHLPLDRWGFKVKRGCFLT